MSETGSHMVSEIQKMIGENHVCPKDARFESQNDEEHILLLMRAHPITNCWILLSTLTMPSARPQSPISALYLITILMTTLR